MHGHSFGAVLALLVLYIIRYNKLSTLHKILQLYCFYEHANFNYAVILHLKSS